MVEPTYATIRQQKFEKAEQMRNPPENDHHEIT